MTTTDPETILAWTTLTLFAVYLGPGSCSGRSCSTEPPATPGSREISAPVVSAPRWAGVLFVVALRPRSTRPAIVEVGHGGSVEDEDAERKHRF